MDDKLKKHCCDQMNNQINDWSCDHHKDRFDCPDALINYIDKFDEYGIIIHDGGFSHAVINYCPYCGTKLPESKRDLWFDTLEKMGFDNPTEQEIPEVFKSDKWYLERKG